MTRIARRIKAGERIFLRKRGRNVMGEIRVQVKLVNAVDDERRRAGKLAANKVRSYLADAVVDTGAVRSVIPAHVLERLGVSIRSEHVARYTDGREETVGRTGPIILEVEGREALESALVLGDEVLIGQTALEQLDLLADCTNRRLVPNPEHPDQPVSKIRRRRKWGRMRDPLRTKHFVSV